MGIYRPDFGVLSTDLGIEPLDASVEDAGGDDAAATDAGPGDAATLPGS